jgi:hypothetical protein
MQRNRPCVYGCVGRENTSRAVPVSTISPAYITATWVATRATTPRSWVIKITAMSSSRWIDAKRRRICAWMVTSSAVVGSSAMRSLGPHISAMAIMMRWRKPPES